MDFTKYVSFLEKRSLYFARSDLFEDPYEGATSRANTTLRSVKYKDEEVLSNAFKQLSQFAEWVRVWTYINCWHMNEYESSAMWKLYAHADEAVAIQSTFEKLNQNLPSGVYLGVVKYIDYEKDWMPEGNSFWPFVHKRKSFEHEREIRAVIQKLPIKDNVIATGMPNTEHGRSIPININELVEKVFISPTAPSWFAELVSTVTQKFDAKFSVEQSLLAKKPVF